MTSASSRVSGNAERPIVCGRGGAGNMHTPSEIRALDEEESKLTAQLTSSHSHELDESMRKKRRRNSIFSFRSKSSTKSSSSTIIDKILRRSSSVSDAETQSTITETASISKAVEATAEPALATAPAPSLTKLSSSPQ